jgi:acyl carrier protein
MDRDTAFELVKKFLTERFEVPEEKIQPDARFFEDLDLDSVDALDMLAIIESELKVSIDEVQARQIRTIQDAVEFIQRMSEKKAQSDGD